MTNIQYFKKEVKYWAKRLNIRLDDVKMNKRMWYMAMASWGHNNNHIVYYQPRYFNHERKFYIMRLIFHELGHFKNKNFSSQYPYDKFTNQMIAEYKAEIFALKCLKKYYPEYYRAFCRYIKRSGLKRIMETDYMRHGRYYFLAFSQIKEYATHL